MEGSVEGLSPLSKSLVVESMSDNLLSADSRFSGTAPRYAHSVG